MSSPWFKTDVHVQYTLSCVLNEALPIYLKRAVAKDAGEDGSGQHGEDGQDHRHAVCGAKNEKLIFLGGYTSVKNMKKIRSY